MKSYLGKALLLGGLGLAAVGCADRKCGVDKWTLLEYNGKKSVYGDYQSNGVMTCVYDQDGKLERIGLGGAHFASNEPAFRDLSPKCDDLKHKRDNCKQK